MRSWARLRCAAAGPSEADRIVAVGCLRSLIPPHAPCGPGQMLTGTVALSHLIHISRAVEAWPNVHGDLHRYNAP